MLNALVALVDSIDFCVWMLTLFPLYSSSRLSLQYKAVILICCFTLLITFLSKQQIQRFASPLYLISTSF